jgi:hypothetical protein
MLPPAVRAAVKAVSDSPRRDVIFFEYNIQWRRIWFVAASETWTGVGASDPI